MFKDRLKELWIKSGVHRSCIAMYNFKDESYLFYLEWVEPFIHSDISFLFVKWR